MEQLTLTAELEVARRAHAVYYVSLAEAAEPQLAGIDQKAWSWRLEVEQANLRAALHWAIEQHEGELAQRMVGALRPFWFARGYWSEGRRWLEDSLALDSVATPNPAVRAKALYGAGVLARFQGDFARARMLCEQSLTLYRTLADNSGVVMALVQLGRIGTFQDDQTATKAFLAEAAALIDALPDTIVKADAYTDMVVAMISPSPSQLSPVATHYLAESERIHRTLHNQAGLAFALLHQATRALFEGDYTLAASRFDEGQRLAMELGDVRLHSRLALSRVLLDFHEGDFATARRRLDDSLQQAGSRGDHHLPFVLVMLAAILHRQGLASWSARVFGMAEVWTRAGPVPTEVAAIEQHLSIGDIRAEVRARLGDEAFAGEIAAGQQLTLDNLRAIPHPAGPVPATQSVSTASSASLTSLTTREIEVLRLLAQDLSNPQIAEWLVVSRRTVDAHLRSIYDKLGVKSREAAIRVATEQGLVGKQDISRRK